jgi:hypothetical protein
VAFLPFTRTTTTAAPDGGDDDLFFHTLSAFSLDILSYYISFNDGCMAFGISGQMHSPAPLHGIAVPGVLKELAIIAHVPALAYFWHYNLPLFSLSSSIVVHGGNATISRRLRHGHRMYVNPLPAASRSACLLSNREMAS